MSAIKKILVPVDFHKHTDNIVKFAINFAAEFDATVTFYHVVEIFNNYTEFSPAAWSNMEDELLFYARDKMKSLVNKNREICKGCTGEVESGYVVETIIQYAKNNGHDLIIIGSHGRKGIEKILIGSVAERVVRRALCSTLLYRTV